MPQQTRKAARASARAVALLAAFSLTAILSAAQDTANDASGTLTVTYGNASTLIVGDWHFVYEYLESDTPLDAARVTACTKPSPDASCMKHTKTTKDLLLAGPVPGLSAVGLVPYVLPAGAVRAIRIHWNAGSKRDGRNGLTLKQNTPGGTSDSLGVSVITAQGAEIYFEGTLHTPETFLSSKTHVYPVKLSLTGSVQAEGAPRAFDLRLDSRKAPPSANDRVDEVWFH